MVSTPQIPGGERGAAIPVTGGPRPESPRMAAMVGSGRRREARHSVQTRMEVAMGLLDGKKALIFGVANDHSIAWGIARALHNEGATLGFSSVESLIEKRVRPLATSIGSTFVEPCDVQSDEQIRAVMEKWRAQQGQIDVLVHALAFA